MRYFKAVNAIAQAWLLNGCVSAGMSPVFGSTPIVSPVKRGITQTISVISRIAYVQKYMQICAHSGGLPLFFVSWFTRILNARNKIASIGAKLTVSVAVCKIFWMGTLSYFNPQLSAAMRQIANAVYTSMNWIVRLITHCMAVVTPWSVLNCDPTTGTLLTLFTTSSGSPSACKNVWSACAAANSNVSNPATIFIFNIISLCSLADGCL